MNQNRLQWATLGCMADGRAHTTCLALGAPILMADALAKHKMLDVFCFFGERSGSEIVMGMSQVSARRTPLHSTPSLEHTQSDDRLPAGMEEVDDVLTELDGALKVRITVLCYLFVCSLAGRLPT